MFAETRANTRGGHNCGILWYNVWETNNFNFEKSVLSEKCCQSLHIHSTCIHIMRVCIINPRRMHHRVTVVVLCVCLSVTTLAATCTCIYLVVSPKCSVIRFLMAFQMHDLCGFRQNHFVCQCLRQLLILSLLTSELVTIA